MLMAVFGTAAKAQSADENAVASNCKLLNQGLISRNKHLLESLAANGLSYGHSNGDVETKAVFVKNVMNKKVTYVAINIPNQTISIVGDNAIVRQVQELKLIKDGKKTDLKIGNLLIWHKEAKTWKLVAKQGYKLQ